MDGSAHIRGRLVDEQHQRPATLHREACQGRLPGQQGPHGSLPVLPRHGQEERPLGTIQVCSYSSVDVLYLVMLNYYLSILFS